MPAAEAELLHEVEYYSNARSGTGIRFQAAVEATLERAASAAPQTPGLLVVAHRIKADPCVESLDHELFLAGLTVHVARMPHRRAEGLPGDRPDA